MRIEFFESGWNCELNNFVSGSGESLFWIWILPKGFFTDQGLFNLSTVWRPVHSCIVHMNDDETGYTTGMELIKARLVAFYCSQLHYRRYVSRYLTLKPEVDNVHTETLVRIICCKRKQCRCRSLSGVCKQLPVHCTVTIHRDGQVVAGNDVTN